MRARFRREDEDVAFYVREVIGWAVGREHAAKHPLCRSLKMDAVMFQTPEDARYIGDPDATYTDVPPSDAASWRKPDGD